MAKYIDADKLLAEAKALSGPVTGDGWDNWGVYALIERQLAVDAVEVVRCRDCKHRPIRDDFFGVIEPKSDFTCPFLCSDPYYSAIPKDEFYCAHGERKAENG